MFIGILDIAMVSQRVLRVVERRLRRGVVVGRIVLVGVLFRGAVVV